jgi:FkbM family methyltransferase
MSRKIHELISLRSLQHIPYVFLSILKIKNWPLFLLNYIGIKNCSATYHLRNGLKIHAPEGVDASTVMVIFIKKDYGKIPNNAVIIDVGANIGTFSLYAVQSAKNISVYAYEPMPGTFKTLEENIKINKLQKTIKPFKLGTAAKKETRELYLSPGSPFHSMYIDHLTSEKISIKCIPLQEIFEKNKVKKCDLLKMDCEGAEFETLYNTPPKYLKKIKEIRLEYHNELGGNNVNDLIKFLEKNGFKLYKKKEDSTKNGNAWFVLN